MIGFEDAKRVYGKLVDKKSKDIFNMYFSYAMGKSDYYDFYNLIKEESDIKLYEYDQFLIKSTKPVALYGAGRVGIYTYQLLKDRGYEIVAVADSFFSEKKKSILLDMGGTPIFPNELCKHIGEWRVAITSTNYKYQIMDELLRMGFPYEDIFYPPYDMIRGWCGIQYFDFFEPKGREVFVDGGVLDGNSTVEFSNWAKDHYEGAILFEANPICLDTIEKTMENNGINNYRIINKGMSDREKQVRFDGNNGGGAHITENGDMIIECNSLDNELQGEYVSLIKMDIEGAESEALEGCRKTIMKHRPRLAISVYHKKDDFLNIPLQILDMVEDYKFAMRHYCSVAQETVLYGWID